MAAGHRKLKVIIGIDEAYTNDAIRKCFENRTSYELHFYDHQNDQKQSINQLHYDLYWLEYEYLNFEQFLDPSTAKKILFNSYCIRKGLIRKAQVSYYIKKYLLKNPNSILKDRVPETYIFELDHADYLDEALNECFEVENELKANETRDKQVKFILKPSLANRAAEILIFNKRSQLEDKFSPVSDSDDDEDGVMDLREWVIQRYIDNPCLLDSCGSRKFHLRVYVLAVGDLKVFVYENILALFCQKSYDSSSDELSSHITNTCFQYKNENFNEADCVKEFWSLVFDARDASNDRKLKNQIFDQIKSCVSELFSCLYCEKIVFQPVTNAFELYGFDFLVDDRFNAYFLEANAFPDFKQTGSKLNDLIATLFYQTISVCVDPHFGFESVCDPNKMHLVLEKQ
jgi:tubulin--tyrosine ligase